jgi:hypothetical protein
MFLQVADQGERYAQYTLNVYPFKQSWRLEPPQENPAGTSWFSQPQWSLFCEILL